MCLILALFSRFYYGGAIYIQIFPLHFVVKYNDQMIHGTNKRGKWEIEKIEWKVYAKWLESGFHPIRKLI